MKRILFIIAAIWSTSASAQLWPGYQYFNSKNDWYMGRFRALHLPAYGDTALQAGQNRSAGAVIIDTTGANQGFYYWMNNRWNKVGDAVVQAPLYKNGDTIILNQADVNNDGYLDAAHFAKFDSAGNMWKDTLPSLPAMAPKGKMVYASRFLLGPNSAIAYYNTAWDSNPYPLISANPQAQNAYYGDRGGATRTLNGSATGTENTGIGSQTAFAITTGSYNSFLGKGAGSGVTSGDMNVYIGHNMSGGATPTVSGQLGIGGNGNYWIKGENYGADITLPAQTIATNDSDKTAATTEWVKRQGYGSGGGGITDLTPEETFTTSNFTITEGANGRDKTYIVITSGTDITVTAPASPTAGRRITIFLFFLTPGGGVIVPTYDGTRTLTTSGTSFTLQWSATLSGYIIVANS